MSLRALPFAGRTAPASLRPRSWSLLGWPTAEATTKAEVFKYDDLGGSCSCLRRAQDIIACQGDSRSDTQRRSADAGLRCRAGRHPADHNPNVKPSRSRVLNTAHAARGPNRSQLDRPAATSI